MKTRQALVLAAGFLVLLASCTQTGTGGDEGLVERLSRISFAPSPQADDHAGKAETISMQPDGKKGTTKNQTYFGSDGTAGHAPRVGVEASGDSVRLAFDGADLKDVVRIVLGDTLHLNYIMDPKIQGSVTLVTSSPISRADLLATLETILQMNGAALVQEGDGYRIVNAADAVGRARIAPLGREEGALPAGYGITILPLHYISASTMAELLGPVKGLPGAVRVDAAHNLLVLAGSAPERQYLLDTVKAFDVDWLANMSVGIFPLKHTDPATVINELQFMLGGGSAEASTTGAQGQNASGAPPAQGGDTKTHSLPVPQSGAGNVRFLAIDRLHAVLAVSPSAGMLKNIERWVERLDQGTTTGLDLYVYYLKNGKAAEIASILNQVFGTGGGSAGRSAGRQHAGPGGGYLGGAMSAGGSGLGASGTGGMSGIGGTGMGGTGTGGMGGGMGGGLGGGGGFGGTGGFGGMSRSGADLSAFPTAGTGPSGTLGSPELAGGRVIPDDFNNSLLIMATPAAYRMIEAALRQIDVPAQQVLIEATIAEVTLNKELNYGLQFFLNNLNVGRLNSGAILTSGAGTQGLSTSFSGAISADLPGFSYVVNGGGGPKAILDALSSVTDVKVISSPHLVVQDNQEARLQVGDQVPIQVQQAQSVETVGAPIVTSVQYVTTGVILDVMPRISAGGTVSLDIEQEVSSVPNSSSVNLTPTISDRKIDSSVAVQSGQTAVLGGLISETTSKAKSGLPFLSDIPFLAPLTGSTSDQLARTELIVFITPRVLHDATEAQHISEELRDKILGLSHP